MGLPIAAIQVGISDGIATVEHPAIPHIQATVGHAVGVGGGVGVFEKYQVAGPWGAGSGAVVVKPLRPQPPDVPAALAQHIGQVAGAVKGRAGAVAAPDDERIIPKRLPPQNYGRYGGHNTTRICPKDA